MLSSFSIANFKAFGPAQEIPLRPITLVFGPNSAGKSSIIQSLLLARHIRDTGNADAHQTTLGGAAVDLGGFTRFVHRRRAELDVELRLTFPRSSFPEQFHYFDKFEALTVVYSFGFTYVVFRVVNSVRSMRVSQEVELGGLDVPEFGMVAYPEDAVEMLAAGTQQQA